MQNYIKSPHTQTFKASKIRGLLFFFLFFSLFHASAYGQIVKASANEKIHFGLSIGGACNTTFPMSDGWKFAPAQTKIGVSGGAYFEFDFAKRFFVHIEANISSRRLLASGFSADTTRNNYDIAFQYTNISVPLGVGVSFFPAESRFNAAFILGPIVGMPQENKSQISVNRQDVLKSMRYIHIGLMAELRMEYDFVFLAFRYEFSGTDLFKYQKQSFKTGTFNFLVGFKIL